MIFDVGNWLWKSNFSIFWHLSITPIRKIQWFPLNTVGFYPKKILILYPSLYTQFTAISFYPSLLKDRFFLDWPSFATIEINKYLELFYFHTSFVFTRYLFSQHIHFSWNAGVWKWFHPIVDSLQKHLCILLLHS